MALGLLAGGFPATADVAVINDRATRTLLYEVRPTQHVIEGIYHSEPIALPTMNGPVMVMTSIVDPLLFFPDPGYGSASVTLTYHPRGVGFFPDNGALSWSGINARGEPTSGLVRLSNSGDGLGARSFLTIARDNSASLITGPRPGEIRVQGPRNSVIRVRLIW
jgi:hypothetical protein